MTSYTLTPEQVALYAVARTTWRRRQVAKARGLRFGEESITDTILMDLAETFPGSLSVVPFSKPSEGMFGADWAWLFRDSTGSHNLPMLVQAKALDFNDIEYAEIKRHIGRKKPPVRQIDRFIETAEKWSWPAIYAFYNHLDDISRIPQTCHSLPASSVFGIIPESWGISIASAYAVREALDDQTFDTHRMHSKPLHCLLCSRGLGERPPGGSPELALNSFRHLPRPSPSKTFSADSEEVGVSEPRIFPEPAEPRILDEPPDIFKRALVAASSEHLPSRLQMIEELGRENPSLAGVIILQDSKGQI